jgi:8-oxo-dGTP pyrophosphatase MutT (NUDIX family)
MTLGRTAGIQRTVFRTFGILPKPLRRLLIRTIRPTWTAGAVAIIERDDGRWLFVRPVYRKGWALPGGLVDRGEHPATTVVRELREELGITVAIASDGWVIIDTVLARVETVYRVTLAADVDPDAIRITTPELTDLGWYRPHDPPAMEDETDDVLRLAAQVKAGGSAVWIRPDA